MTNPSTPPNGESTTPPTQPADVAATYFDAWQARDADRLRSILADDVTFRGALGTADGIDECIAGLLGMAQMLASVEVQHRWVDGADVITWFDLHTTVASPTPTVNWSHVEDGKINQIRVTFDPREILAAGQD